MVPVDSAHTESCNSLSMRTTRTNRTTCEGGAAVGAGGWRRGRDRAGVGRTVDGAGRLVVQVTETTLWDGAGGVDSRSNASDNAASGKRGKVRMKIHGDGKK